MLQRIRLSSLSVPLQESTTPIRIQMMLKRRLNLRKFKKHMQSYLTRKRGENTMSLAMKDQEVLHSDLGDSRESTLVSMIFLVAALNQFLANFSVGTRVIEHVVQIYW